MISNEEIHYKLYEEFIKPTNQKKNFIGIEIEIPIINLDKKAVNFDIVHKVTDEFKNHYSEFKEDGIDYEGNVFSLKNPKTEDMICYDCSYNNIEFAMGRKRTYSQSVSGSYSIISLLKKLLKSIIIH